MARADELTPASRACVVVMALALMLVLAACESARAPSQAASSRADAALSSKDRRPVAVLHSSSVWSPSGRLPAPRVVVYEDGLVVFTRWEGGRFTEQFRTLTLAPEVLGRLRREVHALAALRPLRPSYEALEDGWSVDDAAYDKLYVRDGRREVLVSVYALHMVLSDHELPGRSSMPPMRLRPAEKGGPPPQFMNLYHRLDALARTPAPAATLWQPRHVEVCLRDDPRSIQRLRGRPAAWPAEWPVRHSPTVREVGVHAWVVRLDGTKLAGVRRVLGAESTDSDDVPVVLDGKTWAASWRPVWPGESYWSAEIRNPYRYQRRTPLRWVKERWERLAREPFEPWWETR